MMLKSVELENIRSYAREKVEFPLGTTLLSGDVGCGKSSVLLAVEFALFGIQRGELSGTDLLRHGKKEGNVKLCFEVAGKEVIISRSLKRDSKGISQDSGFIQTDGVRQNKTASELRAIVLELLGYPLEYQTKNPIVFRYTVYTPQDDMKRILFSGTEERLGILRKIFQIDKYGRIRANADIAIRELRAMKREAESLSSDLENLVEEADTKRNQLDLLGLQFKQQQSAAEEVGHKLSDKMAELDGLTEQIRNLGKKAQLAATKESMVRQQRSRNQDIEREIKELESSITLIEKSLGARPIALALSETELNNRKSNLKKRSDELVALQSLLTSEIVRYNSILKKGVCSFCEQSVGDSVAFAQKVIEKETLLSKTKAELAELLLELEQIDKQRNELFEYNYKIRLYANSERELSEKRDRARRFAEELSRNAIDIAAAESELAQLHGDLCRIADLEALERKSKSEIIQIQSEKSEIDRLAARIESQIESLTRELGKLDRQVIEKQRFRDRAVRLSKSATWLEQTFVPLMQTIEQTVMSAIQQEFNQVFQSWFGMLMGNENLSVEADDQFAPLIMQEGYQTEYQNLSGGEKTAVALAYRLALNKAINALIENIRTKDLIILDEPTDGFSSEQIDRIRDVLNELNLQQTILVSHEPKIETFVENIIRFQKEGHLSKVVKVS